MIRESELDLLQRDLDGDLTFEEKQHLNQLLKENSELFSMYERLRRVSHQLADLPPVTPAFSLVDSILPILEKERIGAIPPKPMAEQHRKQQEVQALSVKQAQAVTIAKRRIPSWIPRVGSGVAAASLLLGLFFMVKGQLHQPAPSAETGGTVVVNPAPVVSEQPPVTTSKKQHGPAVPPKTEVKSVESKNSNVKKKAVQKKTPPVKSTPPPVAKPKTVVPPPVVTPPPVIQSTPPTPIFPGAGSPTPGMRKEDREESEKNAEKVEKTEKPEQTDESSADKDNKEADQNDKSEQDEQQEDNAQE